MDGSRPHRRAGAPPAHRARVRRQGSSSLQAHPRAARRRDARRLLAASCGARWRSSAGSASSSRRSTAAPGSAGHGPDGRARGARPRPHAGADARRRCCSAPTALLLGGSDAQQQAHLPAVVAGERLLALAYQEPRQPLRPSRTSRRAPSGPATAGGSAARRSRCSTATAPTGSSSRRAPPAASRDADGITLFLVPRDAPGLGVERQRRVDARGRRAGAARRRARSAPPTCSARWARAAALLGRVLDRATIGALRRDARRHDGGASR